MSPEDIRAQKAKIRRRVWELLEEANLARFPRPVFGRIPNFEGADQAATRLAELPEFARARTVKINPDAPQRMVRYQALARGKQMLTPTPRLRHGFLLLEPAKLPQQALRLASTLPGAVRFGRRVSLPEAPSIDLIVVGSVAVAPSGARVGKGEGYGEIEYALLRATGRVAAEVPVATTVHDAQLVPTVPWEEHDVSVDLIVTPTQTFHTQTRYPKPAKIFWERLTDEKIRAIPLLAERQPRHMPRAPLP